MLPQLVTKPGRIGRFRDMASHQFVTKMALGESSFPHLISKADFTFCMTAIDWGWSFEAAAERLMQKSAKAQENGERYALTTAAAVERRGQPLKSTPHL